VGEPHQGGEWLVYGPPGTGKTTWIAEQAKRAVQIHGPGSVWIASLTRAARSEVQRRNLPVDHRQVSTIHSHCFRALNSPQLTVDHLEEWNSAYPDMAISADDDNFDYEWSHQNKGDELLQKYDRLRALMIPMDDMPEEVKEFAVPYEEWKRTCGYMDFTDLIAICLSDVDSAPGNPDIGFVDEAQDSSALELALVRKWGKRMGWWILVGDPNQTIYQFRGATPEAFMAGERSHQIVLKRGHRLPRAVHAASQKWLQANGLTVFDFSPTDKDGWVEYRAARGYAFTNPYKLVEEMCAIAHSGKTAMILAPCGYMLDNVIACLRDARQPFWNPYRRTNGRWNPLHPPTGTPARERVQAFLRPLWILHRDKARPWTWKELELWAEPTAKKQVLRHGAWADLQKNPRPADSVLSHDDMESVLSPEAHDFAAAMLAGNVTVEEALEWYADKIREGGRSLLYAVDIALAHGPTALQSDPNIIVGTIHSVKGAEADVVALLPDLSPSFSREYAYNPKSVARLLYVGMTRAREGLILCRGVACPPALNAELAALAV
jgi:DNA helicase-2/ATP-dependent DNA helicase PcrA